MRTTTKLFGALAVAGVVAAGGSAFTASNTVPNHLLGNGAAVVSGAVVTSTNYDLSADKTTINAVHFVLSTPVSLTATAEIRLADGVDADVSPYSTCAVTDATHLDCTIAGSPLVASVEKTQLSVH
jgi:hypothetical protein